MAATGSVENIQEEVFDDNKSTVCQQLMTQLEQLKNCSKETDELKKQAWVEFISVWSEILQSPLSNVQPCYIECAHLLPIMIKSTNFFTTKRELRIAQESFSACFIQFDQSHIREFLYLTKEAQLLSENVTYYIHIYHLLMIAGQTALIIPFSTAKDQQFIDNHKDTITILIECIERNMPTHSETNVENKYNLGEINERILSLLWNLADRTVLIPTLLKCNLAKCAISWLSNASLLTEKSRRPLISIIHNIARHDEGADELNKYEPIPLIKHYQQQKLEKTDSRILIGSMALALLSTPEQIMNDKKGMNIVLNQLLQLTINSAKTNASRINAFHVSEPLAVMVKIFVVEERTLDYVLCHAETTPPSDPKSTIHLFINIFFEFRSALNETGLLEQFTLNAVLNILWSISFKQEYHQELINSEKLITTLREFIENNNEEEIVEQYKPRSMEGIKEAVNGILHNLNLDNKNESILNEQQHALNDLSSKNRGSIDEKPWIMISYCHGNNNFCGKLLDLLRTHHHSFKIWIDQTHCQSATDLWESIAEGIERATLILCLLSRQYFESKSCRKEFTYATELLKKPVIPVLLEDFQPRSWLGIGIAGLKYIRIRDTVQSNETKMNEILNSILLSLSSSSIPQKIPLTHAPPLSSEPPLTLKSSAPIIEETSSLRPIEQWSSNNNDINAWFSNNRIPSKIRDLFDFPTGEEMLDYAELLVKDREKQMNIYSKVYSQKYNGSEMAPHEFIRFAKALEKLYTEHSSSSHIKKQKHPDHTASRTCVIL